MKLIPASLLSLMTLMMIQCKPGTTDSGSDNLSPAAPRDVHSYARPDEAIIKHLALDLTVDFTSRTLAGSATYDIEVKEGADSIWLDAKDLDIRRITVDSVDVGFTLSAIREYMGQGLAIPVQPDSRQIKIEYQTSPDAEALQWLQPSQTAGKKQPYLFTQGQAILTRTWIPIQDSPGIRLSYSATIRVPKELMAVMSATNPQEKSTDGVYQFEMRQPIPAYLIALAVGDLAFKPVGSRTGVYSEPAMVDRAAEELSDMERMVETAEGLYGAYRWDRYDVIVLPPSFPFGGMENPKLTFATPTIIAGDKSLVALIAHELAHSWSGNLVTNATWNDFWLNEGFTVYIELRIMESLYGKSYSDMLTSLGHQSLVQTVQELDPKDTHLFLDLEGRNPDDGMNDIAYEKGAHFLLLLEEKVGREKFDAFLKNYFIAHAFQSMSTQKFAAYLDQYMIKPNQLDVNVDEWINGPGLPANCPEVKAVRFTAVDRQVEDFLGGIPPKDLKTGSWSTHEWLHFILALPDTSLTTEQMKALDTAFGFTASGNSEIQAAWYKLSIRQGYGKEILPSIERFLVEVGRRKFLTPLYSALIDAGMQADAERIFAKARPNYHSVAYNTIETLLSKGEKKVGI